MWKLTLTKVVYFADKHPTAAAPYLSLFLCARVHITLFQALHNLDRSVVLVSLCKVTCARGGASGASCDALSFKDDVLLKNDGAVSFDSAQIA